jgi:hypothetical protein
MLSPTLLKLLRTYCLSAHDVDPGCWSPKLTH